MRLIGYTPVDSEGNPIRPHKSGYSWSKGHSCPPRIYTTLGRAEAQSANKKAVPVFIEDPE